MSLLRQMLIQGSSAADLAEVISPSTPANLAGFAQKGLRVIIGPTDPISNIPVMMLYDHHQIHEGESWHWDYAVSNLAAAATYDVVLTVPNITIASGQSAVMMCPHFRYSVEVNDLCDFFLYEGPTVGAGGTARTPINFERNGAYTPKMTILDAPAITAVGTLLDRIQFIQGTVGAKSGGGLQTDVNEFVLKNNTKYLVRLTSGAAGLDAFIDLHWYEDLGV